MKGFEWVRQRALDSLGPHADPRAREVLMRADVEVEPCVVEWTGSSGRMEGHRVRLWVDARSLGVIRGAPAVEDALRAAVAVALASRPHETLDELAFGWRPAATPGRYRDQTPDSETPGCALGGALIEYLHGAGDEALARAMGHAKVQVSRAHGARPLVRAEIVADEGRSPLALGRLSTAVELAARDLLGDRNAQVVVCRACDD